MKCPLCGKPVAEDDVFCGSCGYSLVDDQEPAVEAAQVPSEEEAQAEPMLLAEPAQETVETFEVPVTVESGEAAKPARNWRTIIIVAIVLFFMLCCCCIGSVWILNLLSGSGYSYSY